MLGGFRSGGGGFCPRDLYSTPPLQSVGLLMDTELPCLLYGVASNGNVRIPR